jgi:hypothetical protein
LTADEYRSAIDRLGLSQVKAGAFLGVDQRSSRRYAAAEVAIPGSVELALACAVHLVEDQGWTLDQVQALRERVTAEA